MNQKVRESTLSKKKNILKERVKVKNVGETKRRQSRFISSERFVGDSGVVEIGAESDRRRAETDGLRWTTEVLEQDEVLGSGRRERLPFLRSSKKFLISHKNLSCQNVLSTSKKSFVCENVKLILS